VAYFEQHLLDYDAAINWGNWQYLAGVGADQRISIWVNKPRQYDQEGIFIKKMARPNSKFVIGFCRRRRLACYCQMKL
jgi:deoxyribodipyrimidine photolyase